MSTTGSIDLSRLPPPEIVEDLSFEEIFKQMQQQVCGIYPMLFKNDSRQPEVIKAERITDENGEVYFRIPAVVENMLYVMLESDPSSKLLAVWAYRECMIRQRINDSLRSVMLAFAQGSDLDQHAANYGLERLELEPADPDADPPTEAVMESDIELRRRVLLAFERLSVAGPEGAYIAHSLNAHADVLDVSVSSPDKGQVLLTVQSKEGDGSASDDLIKAVDDAVNADDKRPLTDQVIVQSVIVVEYEVEADLLVYDGLDETLVLEEAIRKTEIYTQEQHRIGLEVTHAGLYAALFVEGVRNVTLNSPQADLPATDHTTHYCTDINVTLSHDNDSPT